MRFGQRLLLRLYPRAWRQRYERELDGLLQDAPFGWFDIFDLVKGALTMRMRTITARSFSAAALLTVVGAMAGMWIDMSKQVDYLGAAVFTVEAPVEEADVLVKKWTGEVYNAAFLRDLILQSNLYPDQRARMPIEEVVEAMRRDIVVPKGVAAGSSLSAYAVTFIDQDRSTAKSIAQVLRDQLLANTLETGAKRPVLKPLGVETSLFLREAPRTGAGAMGALTGLILAVLLSLWAPSAFFPGRWLRPA